MGIYVEPKGVSNEAWLDEHSTSKSKERSPYTDIPKDHSMVFLVDNWSFAAAGIAFDEQEYNRFVAGRAQRPVTYYIVPDVELEAVTGGQFSKYRKKVKGEG